MTIDDGGEENEQELKRSLSSFSYEGDKPVSSEGSDSRSGSKDGKDAPLCNHKEDIECHMLETSEQLTQRKKSHLIIYVTTFTMSIGFSIVLTGIWPYLKQLDPSSSKELLGWVVAINPLGQMIASPILGWWGSKSGSHRLSFILTISMFIVGNIIYSILPLFNRGVKYIMLLSRFIIGVSSANVAICRLYISASTKVKERTTALSITAASQSMGYIFGPIIQTVFAYAFPSDSGSRDSISQNWNTSSAGNNTGFILDSRSLMQIGDVFNMYSLTGWFTAVLGFINLFIFLPCIFKEYKIAETEERRKDLVSDRNFNHESKINSLSIVLILVSYFSILLMYVLLETLIVPLTLDMYAWKADFAVKVVGVGLTIAGAVSMVMFILSGYLAKIYNDRIIYVLLGLVPLTLSMLVLIPMIGEHPKVRYCPGDLNGPINGESLITNSTLASRVRRGIVESDDANCDAVGCPAPQEWCFYTPIIHIPQLIVGSCLMVLGYPVGFSLSSAIFSKLLRAKDQGFWMGVLTSSGSLSRFMGPIIVSYIYTIKGPLWNFSILFCLLLVILILNLVFYERLMPLGSFERTAVSQEQI